MNSNYLSNIIPRLKKFAQKIEIKEALVDKVWVIYGDTDLIEYEFERTGEIAVTKNGNSYDGSWKILGSGRLKIKTDFTNNTLEYDFSIPGILVMKIAGRQNIPFLLYDPKLVPDGNIINYLLALEANKITLPPQETKAPSSLHDRNDMIRGCIATIIGTIILILVFAVIAKYY